VTPLKQSHLSLSQAFQELSLSLSQLNTKGIPLSLLAPGHVNSTTWIPLQRKKRKERKKKEKERTKASSEIEKFPHPE